MFYLNTIEQLFLFVEQLDQLEVCLLYIRLLTGIPILAVFQNLRWNSNKTFLFFADKLTEKFVSKCTKKVSFTNVIRQYISKCSAKQNSWVS